jgi:hypothetical protein
MIELLEAEQHVALSNRMVERQRELIDMLQCEGNGTVSEQIIFDSLMITLALHVTNRQRVLAKLSFQTIEGAMQAA